MLDQERDFYFHKLREIEKLCVECEKRNQAQECASSSSSPRGDGGLKGVLEILYAKDEADAEAVLVGLTGGGGSREGGVKISRHRIEGFLRKERDFLV